MLSYCTYCMMSYCPAVPGNLHDLHSFPTRRSSDLASHDHRRPKDERSPTTGARRFCAGVDTEAARPRSRRTRSEEHTSELQSHHDLVCRLLLEKKKGHHDTRSHLTASAAVPDISRC